MRIVQNNSKNNIINDVLKLYCSIKEPSLENLFIRLASSISFANWIFKNEKIKKDLYDPFTYDAFDKLCKLNRSFSDNKKIDRPLVVKELDSINVIAIIRELNKIIDVNLAKDILQPFRPIIDYVSSSMMYDSSYISQEDLLRDVIFIRDSYLKETLKPEETPKIKETVKQKRMNMLQYLLNKFTETVSNSANNSGLTDFANDIKSGVLANPISSGLSKYINFDNVDRSGFADVKKIADKIYSRYEPNYGDYNYSLVEISLMNLAGQLSKDDIKQLKAQYEYQKNINSENYPEMSSSISFDKHLNSKYLLLLSSFFVYLQAKNSMPTVLDI